MNDLDDIKQIFFTECAELLADMESRLLNLDEGCQDKEPLNAIFRAAHSIKGGSGAFGFDEIMRVTHNAEALLDLFREGKKVPTRASIDTLLQTVDIVTRLLEHAQNGTAPEAGFSDPLLAALKEHLDSDAGTAPPSPVVHAAPQMESPKTDAGLLYQSDSVYIIEFKPHRHLLQTGNEPLLLLRELATLGDIEVELNEGQIPDLTTLQPADCYLAWTITLSSTEPLEKINEVFEFVENAADIKITKVGAQETESQAAAVSADSTINKTSENSPVVLPQATGEAKPAATPQVASIRVDLDKIDRLVNMVGEIVITEAMLRAKTRDLPIDVYTDLMKGIDDLSQHTRELQEAVMSVRMQPVKSIFSRMPRVVRDTSAQLGKKIQLIMVGENTEVDKTIIEQLGDPLTHMIRNSVDHGIELPEKRLAAGKPETGTIRLAAYHQSGQIIIEIQDDGNGINRERVFSKAVEKGLVAADAQLSPEEIDHLVFMPGFSTAEQVTSVSGRGVGMDVVRKNIEGIGGTVHITNTPGKGSVFTVCLPLTLAILDGMIVRVSSESYIIPITAIMETMRPARDAIKQVHGSRDVMNFRGEYVPLIYLDSLFNIPSDTGKVDPPLIVLVESGKDKIGLVVDELIGQQQVVIKSLAENSDPVPGISGATILGDGKVSLILEINELKKMSPVSDGIRAA